MYIIIICKYNRVQQRVHPVDQMEAELFTAPLCTNMDPHNTTLITTPSVKATLTLCILSGQDPKLDHYTGIVKVIVLSLKSIVTFSYTVLLPTPLKTSKPDQPWCSTTHH